MNSSIVVIQRLHNKMNEPKSEIKFEIFQLIIQNEGAAAWCAALKMPLL